MLWGTNSVNEMNLSYSAFGMEEFGYMVDFECTITIYMSTKGKHTKPLKGLLNSLINFIRQISDLINDKKVSSGKLYDL